MRLSALFGIILCLASCNSQLRDYYPPFPEEDFVSVIRPFGRSDTFLPGIKPQFYEGLLIGLADNSDIYAMTNGIVTSACAACERSILGNYIVMENEEDMEITYYHLSVVYVSEDSKISKGQKIAISGNSGMTTVQSGLGVKVLLNGKSVDPAQLIGELISK